jgi:hypothetical protein
MKKHRIVLTLCGALTGPAMLAEVIAQEHKHEEHKEEKTAPGKKATEPAKADAMKCCEGMEKMGDMKAGMPIKAEMKAKMEKMKEMKEKMAEKLGEKGMKMQTPESKVEKNEPSKDAHQH